MILLDFSQIVISCLTMEMGKKKTKTVPIEYARHLVLQAIKAHNRNYGRQYGEMIICCDGSNTWRKDLFPYYKGSRADARESSSFDWNDIQKNMDSIREDLTKEFPYRVICIEGVEADDIIGYICHKEGSDRVLGNDDWLFSKVHREEILIISGDKDFQQLQKFKNVFQYMPVQKQFYECDNAEEFLALQILTGDSGDGVPNILSADNVLLTEGVKQSKVTAKLKEVWTSYVGKYDKFFEDFESGQVLPDLQKRISASNLRKNFDRNVALIDLSRIPNDVKNKIDAAMDYVPEGTLNSAHRYLVRNGLNKLSSLVQDFKNHRR